MESSMDPLRLEAQMCFPLYAVARKVTGLYRPFLDALDLTYTQYLVMMVLWEENHISSKELGNRLYLDSGTLTPVLKALQQKGYITRTRSEKDERVLMLSITADGMALKKSCSEIPYQVGSCMPLSEPDAKELYRLLYELLHAID